MGVRGGVGGPQLVLPLGFGTGGLFLAAVSKIPNKKAITIKKAFTIVFILVLKNNVKFYSTTHKSLIDTVKLPIYQWKTIKTSTIYGFNR